MAGSLLVQWFYRPCLVGPGVKIKMPEAASNDS